MEGIELVIRDGVAVAGTVKADGDRAASLDRVRDFAGAGANGRSSVRALAGRSFEGGWPASSSKDVGPDRYTVAVLNLPEGFYVKSIRSANLDVLAGGMEIEGQSPAPLEILLGPNAGRSPGR